MENDKANKRSGLRDDYADALAEYDAASAVIVKRMEGGNNQLDATPTAAETVAEEQARYRLIAVRRRIYQFGARYLESLPIG